VAGDIAYVCPELRFLPAGVTLTGPMTARACRYEVHRELDNPLRWRNRRGRPRRRGERIGTPAQLAAALPGEQVTLAIYGRQARVTVRERRCLWPGVCRSRPVRVIIVSEPGRPGVALVTTGMTAPAGELVTRYASRRAIEVAFSDARAITGAGEARNRTPRAVERTVPFALFTQSLVITWYQQAGHRASGVRSRRAAAPWYTSRARPSCLDMITWLRRILIAAQFRPEAPREPTPEEIRAIQMARAQAAA
jgi:hypothetical protein